MHQLPEPISRQTAGKLLQLIFVGILQVACVVTSTWITHKLLRSMINDESLISIQLISIIGICAIVSAMCVWYERLTAERLGQNYVHSVRLELFGGLVRNDKSQQKNGGVHLVRFSNDLSALRLWVSNGIASTVSNIFLCLGVLIALTFIDQRLAILCLAALITSVLITTLLGMWLEKSIRKNRRIRGRLANTLNDVIASLPYLKLHGRTRHEQRRVNRKSDELVQSAVTQAYWEGVIRASNECIARMLVFAVMIIGVIDYRAGLTDLAGLLVALGVSALIVTPIRGFGRVFEYFKNYQVARNILQRFLDKTNRGSFTPGELSDQSAAIGDKATGLQLTNVTLDDISFPPTAIETGQRVALVGNNALVIARLIKCLCGVETADQGTIHWQGRPVQYLGEKQSSRNFGLFSPAIPLASGSISKNIRYRAPKARNEDVLHSATLAGLESLLEELDGGLDFRLGHRGEGLTEGQKSRVKIARAILNSPSVLLIDSADSSLDNEGINALQNILDTTTQTIVCAPDSRLSLQHFDQIWTIDKDIVSIEKNNCSGTKTEYMTI